MLFTFLRYLQPTHYFQLYRKDGTTIFPVINELPEEILIQIPEDKNYESSAAAEYDRSWQAIQRGYIGPARTYTSFKKIPPVDEYIFLKKYFNKVWVFYVLLIRLLTIKNPIKEIRSWRNSHLIKRSGYLKNPLLHPGWYQYESSILKRKPLISVIIPTLNRYKYLKDVLQDLEKQDYNMFEVIIVDQSDSFQEDFYAQFKLDIVLIHQTEKALWHARNRAVEASKGDYVLLFDDDSRVKPDWISNHIKCVDYFGAQISSGVSYSKVGGIVPENYSFFRISDQIDTGNVLMEKNIFRSIGLFDRQFEKQRMGDAEFGLRCFLDGFKNISNPNAPRDHLKVSEGGLREMGSWDAFRPKSIFSPRPIPSVLYFYRKYFGIKRSVFSLLKTVPPSIIPYRYKKNRKLMVLGGLISVFLLPVILMQVIFSWRKAGKKLKQGALINELE